MTGTVRTITVQGESYEVWSDFCNRCTYAKNSAGVTKRLKDQGYIHNELTVRKAIATCFGHNSFRK